MANEKRRRNDRSSEIDTELELLVALDTLDYQQRRKDAAKDLGMRVSVLDAEVAKRRKQLKENDDEDVGDFQPFRLQEPWPKPVDGAKLLDELCDVVWDHVVLPEKEINAIALWILFAHTHDVARNSAILMIYSPIKECGKSTLMDLLTKLVPKPWSASNATGPAIFRIIHLHCPTLLLDEADTWIHGKGELRGILDSGHSRAGAFVIRASGTFSTWAPRAISLIGRMPPTLESRSIKIELKKKLPTEKVLPIPGAADAYVSLHRKCRRFAMDHFKELRIANQQATPTMPEELRNRQRDSWLPLIAIAEICGGKWPEKARRAALKLSAVVDDEDLSVQLLEDMKELFEDEGGRHLSSKAIVNVLAQKAHRPWPDFHRGQPITERGVAKLLAPFKIRPRQVVVGVSRVQGYRRDQFNSAFARYLSPASSASDVPHSEDGTGSKSLPPKRIQGMQGI